MGVSQVRRSGKSHMNIQEQIQKYIASLLEPKRSDMQALHRLILHALPECRLWFLDGKINEKKLFPIPILDMDLTQ